ncbi:hypothetical protein OGH69_00670 [Flavobacterium sp. MFBS3-15]|uniref:hypothetical protein n=1 Tax=Flavobacterium sp. MFBS3-15 TaxID=2989816 RepID=UPI00223641D7|nr:hypothetical protein [Flavobacterium sp. MFBS3-15]MCW4467466.1 hypothetical protein [Flavobacterium sp. MFBS3-15]|tara:strand:+ start:228 stop:518 length:291 start_codon:yes stop_codon:yes gene_type:complete
MSGLAQIVDSLESKLEKLALKLDRLQQENRELQNGKAHSEAVAKKQNEEIALLKQQNESLRMANSLLGSDDNKRETKLKINSLIREIDYCIAQLSD